MTTNQTATDIFRKYYADLCRYVQHRFSGAGEADDIVQDAFHNILKINGMNTIENPKAYLYRAARNIALNRIRQKNCQTGTFVELDENEPLTIPMDRQLIAENDMLRVKRALQNLSEKDRTTFLLNRVEGKSYKAISEELGITVSSVEKRMMKVLATIRRAMDDR